MDIRIKMAYDALEKEELENRAFALKRDKEEIQRIKEKATRINELLPEGYSAVIGRLNDCREWRAYILLPECMPVQVSLYTTDELYFYLSTGLTTFSLFEAIKASNEKWLEVNKDFLVEVADEELMG